MRDQDKLAIVRQCVFEILLVRQTAPNEVISDVSLRFAPSPRPRLRYTPRNFTRISASKYGMFFMLHNNIMRHVFWFVARML